MSCIKLCTKSPTPNTQSRHFMAKVAWVWSQVELGKTFLTHLGTKDMTADVLTKPDDGPEYATHIVNMMGLRWMEKFA
jgi:hypothetical protein